MMTFKDLLPGDKFFTGSMGAVLLEKVDDTYARATHGRGDLIVIPTPELFVNPVSYSPRHYGLAQEAIRALREWVALERAYGDRARIPTRALNVLTKLGD